VLALSLGALLGHPVQTAKDCEGKRCDSAGGPNHLKWPTSQECGDAGNRSSGKRQSENLLGAPAAFSHSQGAALGDPQLALGFALFLGDRPSFQLGLDLFGGLGGAGQKAKGLTKPCGVSLGGVVLTAPHPERNEVNKPQCCRNKQQNRAPSARGFHGL
jgi:hypothetical protein